ncbi:MAG: hypothetical protein JWR38_4380 [Mucilaginibacter sp.]|nr:hypothetical protein [Mucilaginibacter sp.]
MLTGLKNNKITPSRDLLSHVLHLFYIVQLNSKYFDVWLFGMPKASSIASNISHSFHLDLSLTQIWQYPGNLYMA